MSQHFNEAFRQITSRRIIAVTGANKGIGFEVVRLLLKKEPESLIVLGSRSESNGRNAVRKLNEEGLKNVMHLECDISSESTCEAFVESLKKLGACHLLINNAATIPDSSPTDLVNTNFYGARWLSMKVWAAWPSCRITNVTGNSGTLFASEMAAEERKAMFETEDSLLASFTDKDLCAFIDQIVEKAEENREESMKKFWVYPAVQFSKIVMAEIFGRDGEINVVCPGCCRTDANKHLLKKFEKTVEEAAECVIEAAYKTPFVSGAYYDQGKREDKYPLQREYPFYYPVKINGFYPTN